MFFSAPLIVSKMSRAAIIQSTMASLNVDLIRVFIACLDPEQRGIVARHYDEYRFWRAGGACETFYLWPDLMLNNMHNQMAHGRLIFEICGMFVEKLFLIMQ